MTQSLTATFMGNEITFIYPHLESRRPIMTAYVDGSPIRSGL